MLKRTCPFCGSTNVYKQGSEFLCGDCYRPFGRGVRLSQKDNPSKILKVFLSYGHVDEEIVRPVHKRLVERGHEVFFDQSDIKLGDDWRARIVESIKRSDVVLAFLSKYAYREGGVCREEIDIALGVRGGNVHTVLLEPEEEVRPPAVFRRHQWINMSSWRERKKEGEELFEVWLDAQTSLLLSALESPQSMDFPGDMTWLSQRLGVMTNNSRQASLVSKPFYGRKWLMDDVESWLDDPLSERVCLITGDVGVGKSAFSAHLQHWGSRIAYRVAGSVFCERGLDAFNNPRSVVCALAYSLAGGLQQYRTLLRSELERGMDIGLLDDASLFTLVISGPLSKAIDGGHESVVIVIDGLDEAGEVGENALAKVVDRCASELPTWVKVLVTSRRIPVVLDSLRMPVRMLEVRGNSVENIVDLRDYFTSELESHVLEQGFGKSVESIIRASDGSFLFAEYMVDAVKKRLVSLDDAAGIEPDGLSGLLSQWFEWTFPSVEEYCAWYRDVLGCILAAPGGFIPKKELQFLLGWDDVERDGFLRRLEVFLTDVEGELGEPSVRIAPTFVAQWLANKNTREYYCDKDIALRLMGRRYYEAAECGVDNLSPWALLHVLRILDSASMGDELVALRKNGHLANSLSKLGTHLVDTGRMREAEGALREALGILRGLADAESDAHLPGLSAVLMNLGNLLRRTGRMREAEGALCEALGILRSLADTELAAHLPSLASTLTCFGNLLSDTGRMSEAEGAYCEALGILRGLSAEEPAAHLLDLARVLSNLGNLHSCTGRMSEAEDAYREALGILRGHVEAEPVAHLTYLATVLSNLGNLLSCTGRMREAEGAYCEALDIRRRLSAEEPAAHLPGLAHVLSNFGNLLRNTGRMSETEGDYREALGILRGLADAEPTVHLTYLATVLMNLGNLLRCTGRMSEAEGAYREALDIRRRLSAEEPAAHLPGLADTLTCFGNLLSDTGRMSEAEGAYREAIDIRRRLSEEEPASHQPFLARVLSNLGNLLSRTGRMSEAEGPYREALGILRNLADAEPAAHLKELATVLMNLGNLLRLTGRMSEAEGAYREALGILRNLADAEPAAHLPGLAHILTNLGVLLSDAGCVGLAGDSKRLSVEAHSLAEAAASGPVNTDALLHEVDLLLSMTVAGDGTSLHGDGLIVQGKEVAKLQLSNGQMHESVKEAIIGYILGAGKARMQRAEFAKNDVADSIDTYASSVASGEVIGVAIARRGLIRKRITGYLCTGDALFSSCLDGSCIPYAEVGQVSLGYDGVCVTSIDGEVGIVDFGEFNEEVFLVLKRIVDALHRE